MIKQAKKTPAVKGAPAGSAAHFYWRRAGAGEVLVTNDSGCHAFLKEREFDALCKGKLPKTGPLYKELASKGFIGDMLDFSDLAAKWKSRNSTLEYGPALHIFVLTLRCNHKCVYCQAGAVKAGRGTDMDWKVARRSADFAFSSTARSITIEFQGGEPLLNWETLRKTVLYARKKEKETGKRLNLALVSNFSLMTEERADFLIANEVSLCTSLDGPAAIHNRNRCFSGGNSHAVAVKWLKYFKRKGAVQSPERRVFEAGALLTVTRHSLGADKAIVDEYAALGLRDIFVRPLSPIGYAKRSWATVGYTPAEFSAFYAKCLDRILWHNRKGVELREKMASLLLTKILGFKDPGYLDVRCPCGAAVGQIAYTPGGDMYTCDEGRMVAWEGDDLFRIGNVLRDSYVKAVSGPTARACLAASELHSQPECSRCAYSPYCGVCPVYNYSAQGSLWGNVPASDRCATMKGIFGALFARLRRRGDREILEKWLKK